MTRRRLLPDVAYDFFAEDGRNGETGPIRSTLSAARNDVRRRRRQDRACGVLFADVLVTVQWRVNERKVLRLLNRRKPRPNDGRETARKDRP